jgi:hypothetical protein
MARPKNPNSQRSIKERQKAEKLRLQQLAEREAQIQQQQQELAAKQAELEAQQAQREAQQARIVEIDDDPEEEIDSWGEDYDEEEIDELLEYEPEPELTDTDDVINDLASLLNEPTHNSPDAEPTAEIPSEPVQPNSSDFTEPAQPEAPQFTTTADGENTKTGIPPQYVADLVCLAMNKANQILGTMAYRKHFFSRDEFYRAKYVYEKYKMDWLTKKEIKTSEAEQLLILKYTDFLEWEKSLPLTQEEEKTLRVPLEQMAIGSYITSSPTSAFLFAVVLMMAARYAVFLQPKPRYTAPVEPVDSDKTDFAEYEEE